MTKQTTVLYFICPDSYEEFLPDYPEGEDGRSMELHMSCIQNIQRLSKEKKNKLQINRLMEITFSHRRRMLVTEFVKVQILVEMYLILCHDEKVKFNFCHVL